MKVAVYPGSFDPITIGHVDIAIKAMNVFDKVIIGVGENKEKTYMFPINKRLEYISKSFNNEKKIIVKSYRGLTVDFCHQNDSKYIVRGIRDQSDFDFEKNIAHTNREISGIETVYFLTNPNKTFVSSSIVRDLIINKGDYKLFIPRGVTI